MPDYTETSYTDDLRALQIGESILEPEACCRDLHIAYKNQYRRGPARFTWKREWDQYGNAMARVTRVA